MGVNLPFKRNLRRAPARVSLLLLAVTLGTILVAMPSSAAPPRPRPVAPVAFTAKTMSLNLIAHLHLVGRPGHALNQQGTVTGDLPGTVSSRSTTITSTRGEGTFTFYSQGGSMSGRAATHGHIVGATAYFSGIANITGGTGKWARVSGSGLQFSGTLDRQNLSATEHLTGNIEY
jgi:hypothetical protein